MSFALKSVFVGALFATFGAFACSSPSNEGEETMVNDLMGGAGAPTAMGGAAPMATGGQTPGAAGDTTTPPAMGGDTGAGGSTMAMGGSTMAMGGDTGAAGMAAGGMTSTANCPAATGADGTIASFDTTADIVIADGRSGGLFGVFGSADAAGTIEDGAFHATATPVMGTDMGWASFGAALVPANACYDAGAGYTGVQFRIWGTTANLAVTLQAVDTAADFSNWRWNITVPAAEPGAPVQYAFADLLPAPFGAGSMLARPGFAPETQVTGLAFGISASQFAPLDVYVDDVSFY
jgi:hypothetical protein